MRVIAICGPLESAVEEFILNLIKKGEQPVRILYESDYPHGNSIDFEKLKKDIHAKKETVLLVGHRFYIDDELKKTLGKALDMKLFLETDPDTCLASFLRKNMTHNHNVDALIHHYRQHIQAVNSKINESKKHADVIIPEKADHKIVHDLLCSSIFPRTSEIRQSIKPPSSPHFFNEEIGAFRKS